MDFIRHTLTPSLHRLYIECHPSNKQFLRCIAIPLLNCNSFVVLRCFVVVFNYLLVAVAMEARMVYVIAIVALIFNVLYLQGAMGATFAIQNQCSYTVWAAGIPVGGGQALGQGQSWSVDVPAGSSSGRFWGRTGCSFDASGKGSCSTGDCGGVLSCTLSGQSPTTLVEYTLNGGNNQDFYGQSPTTLVEYTLNGGNNQDFYDISVIDGFNVPLSLTPSDGSCYAPTCKMDQCPDAYLYPSDNTKTHACPSGANYNILFCP